MQSCRFIPSWLFDSLACMGGCLGCFTEPKLVIDVDEPLKGQKIQGPPVKKSSVSEDFWSTGPIEMENGGIQSQRRISSTSASKSYHALDPNSNSIGTSNPHEFVNQGLVLWNQTRLQWIGDKKSLKRAQVEPRISWNATYGSLLGTNKPFPQPIPLSEMIDFLVDIWEQEGLYD